MVNPSSDLSAIAGTSRSFHQPSVCGVSSDLQSMNISESGVSPNPRDDLSPPPPPQLPKSEKKMPEFFLLPKEERERQLEKILADIVQQINEAGEDEYEVPPIEDPAAIWRRENGEPEPDEHNWNYKPKYDSDDMDEDDAQNVIRYVAPDVLECEICGREHYETCCPYLFEFPSDGVLRNKSDYVLVCDCGEIAVDGRCCPDEHRHPNYTKRVVPNCFDLCTFDCPIPSGSDSDSP